MKKAVFKVLNLIVASSFVFAAVLWMLSLLPATKDTFGGYTFAWAVATGTSVAGIVLFVKGLFLESVGSFKRTYIFAGSVFAVVAVITGIWASYLPNNVILPAIAIVVAVAVQLSIGFTSFSKRWDNGDNNVVGYKNYYQRKSETDEVAKTEIEKNQS